MNETSQLVLPEEDTNAHPTHIPPPPPHWADTDTFIAKPTGTVATTLSDAIGVPVPPDLVDHLRYTVLELLGCGGMGTVYKARHRLMNRLVALKIVNPDLLERPDMVARFHGEVRAAALLSHPNIVAAYDADQAGNTHFLIMEYVPGVNLGQLLRERGIIPIVQACDYIRQAALGLKYAATHGMVHRDIKPQNLMLTPPGQIKICDFGLARFVSEVIPHEGYKRTAAPIAGRTLASLTSCYQAMGTPDYTAPEEIQDARQADTRADIYALGCTLYHLLTGQVPFPADSIQDKWRAHAEMTPKAIHELRPEVPEKVAVAITTMMAKKPLDRFQTPNEVALALARFAGIASAPILVVDDEPCTCDGMKRVLEAEGYTVDCAENGREALKYLRASSLLPALILLDLAMPVMDGWEFLHACKQDREFAAIPVVIISGAHPEQARAIALSSAGYLRKPIEVRELAAEVHNFASRT